MRSKKVRVLDLAPGTVVAQIYGPLIKATGMSGRAEARISRQVRAAIQQALTDTVVKAYADGSAPYRTGAGKRALLAGVRAYGTSFNQLRGHILGPVYMAAHENGPALFPKNSSALAIPLPAALKADGSPKLPGPRSWKNVVGTFIYKSKKTGMAYIAYKNAGGTLTLLYSLVDEAQMSKYTGFLSKSWERQKPTLIQAFGRAMLYEMGQVDVLGLARVTYKGYKKKAGSLFRRFR